MEADEACATITSSTHGHGRTCYVVQCACGMRNLFYPWSWAGHGKARCVGCRGWIHYRDLRVTYDEPKRA